MATRRKSFFFLVLVLAAAVGGIGFSRWVAPTARQLGQTDLGGESQPTTDGLAQSSLTSGGQRDPEILETMPTTANGSESRDKTFGPHVNRSATFGPLRVSRENPRYFADASGKIVVLAGSHTWTVLQDIGDENPPSALDYQEFLDFLTTHGHNFFRLWVWEQARWISSDPRDGLRFAPPIFQRPGPGMALDGFPKFDLTQFNDSFFDRLASRTEQAAQRGIYVSVMLFNGWSVAKVKNPTQRGPNPWKGHPFHRQNNINGIDGDQDLDDSGEESHELVVAEITELQDAYVRKVIDTVNHLDNVLYEISNESHNASAQWQSRMVAYIRSHQSGKPNQHPIGMTVEYPDGSNSRLFESTADWISPKGSLDPRPPSDGSKVILADTDHLCGVCGDRSWAWRSFLAGENPIFMDPYDDEPIWQSLRSNLGFILQVSRRLNMVQSVPKPQLANTGSCLADTIGPAYSYVVHVPRRRRWFSKRPAVDLKDVPSSVLLSVEWLDLDTGRSSPGESVPGGSVTEFEPPTRDETVLLIGSDLSLVTPRPENEAQEGSTASRRSQMR